MRTPGWSFLKAWFPEDCLLISSQVNTVQPAAAPYTQWQHRYLCPIKTLFLWSRWVVESKYTVSHGLHQLVEFAQWTNVTHSLTALENGWHEHGDNSTCWWRPWNVVDKTTLTQDPLARFLWSFQTISKNEYLVEPELRWKLLSWLFSTCLKWKWLLKRITH